MKKVWVALAVVVCLGVGIKLFAGAGNQFNWGTQNGGAWATPDDSKTTVGQVLQIGASGGAVVVASGLPLALPSYTLTQLNALTPGTTGQIAFCSNCVVGIAISSGSTAAGQWVTPASSTTHIN
jgi:hypothetical protein